MKNEKRFLDQSGAEIRLIKKDGEPTKLVGYFAKYNVLSENLGGFREIIEPGFFDEALKTSDIVDLFNHDANFVLGRQSAKTLRVWSDDIGLAYECLVPETQIIKDLVLSPIERNDITGNSFGFRVSGDGDSWDEDKDGRVVRTLKANGCKELFDGSQVTYPAYPETEVSLRAKNMVEERKKSADTSGDNKDDTILKRRLAEDEKREKYFKIRGLIK